MKKYFALSALSAVLCAAVFIIPTVSHGATLPVNPVMGISTSTASTAWTKNPRNYVEYTVAYNTPVTINWTGATTNGTVCSLNSFSINGGVLSNNSASLIWPSGLKIGASGSRNVGSLTGDSYFSVVCTIGANSIYGGVKINVLPQTSVAVPPTVALPILSSISYLGTNYDYRVYGTNNIAGTVHVYQVDSNLNPIGGEIRPLSLSYPTTNTIEFSMPTTSVSGKYWFYVSNDAGKSNNMYFDINTSTQTPSITVISPNGGETYNLNDTLNIKWQSVGGNTTYLYLANENQNGICRLGYTNASAGLFSVIIKNIDCSFLPQGTRFKILAILDKTMGIDDGDIGKARDYSDSVFTISPTSTDDGCSTGAYYSSVTGAPCNQTQTVSIVTKPTLKLSYDSRGKESKLVATATIKVTAGSTNVPFDNNYLNFVGLAIGTNQNSQINLNNVTNTYTLLTTLSTPYIPAGTSATFKLVSTYNPQQMFAGTYVAFVRSYLNGSAELIGTISNKVTIVGEKSPYITSVPSPVDVNGKLIINGVRFSAGDSILIDGSVIDTIRSTSKGIITYSTKATNDSLTFSPSFYNLTAGSHVIALKNPTNGMSNTVGFQLTGTSTAAPQAAVVSDTKFGLTYDANQKEASLQASAQVSVAAGSSDICIPVKGGIYITISNNPNPNSTDIDVNLNNNQFSIQPTTSLTTRDDGFGVGGCYVVPSGTGATFAVSRTVNPKEMFAGTYTAKVSQFYYRNTIGVNFGLAVLSSVASSPVTIVGETSPYITSVTNPGIGSLIMINGARLNNLNSYVYVDGVSTPVSFTSSTDGKTVSFPVSSSWTSGSHSIQLENNNGKSNIVSVQIGNSVPVVQPTVTVVGTPTLKLAYNSAKKESALTGTFDFYFQNGSSDTKIYLNGAMILASDGNSAHNTRAAARLTSQDVPVVSDGSNYIIPANYKVKFRAVVDFAPATMFAGTYSASINNFWGGDGAYAGTAPANKTNAVTIIGETSPYISNITSPVDLASGTIVVTGVRFKSSQILNIGTNAVSLTTNSNSISLSSDGTKISVKPSLINGFPLGAGSYPVYVSDFVNGSFANSNGVNLILTGGITTVQPSITINSVAGPTALTVGQKGTWYVNDVTAFPAGSQLTYAVIWADGTPVSVADGSGIPINSAFVANSTFTHSFVAAGTYYAQFFAKNAAGAANGKGVNITVTSPTPTLTNHAPTGSLDLITNGVAGGWAVDSDLPSTPILVAFYLDGTVGAGGVFLDRIITNVARPDVTTVYPTYTGSHGFYYTIPAQYKDGKQHTLYAYGVDSADGTNKLLNGSPKTFTLAVPVPVTPVTPIPTQILPLPQSVTPVPTVTVTAHGVSGSETLTSGSAETISWTATNTTSCILSYSPAPLFLNWGGIVVATGSKSTGALTSSATFTVTCTGAGGTASGNFTINIQAPQSIATPINGSCGTANGVKVASAPTANLCAVGTASGVNAGTISTPWSWTCAGSNNGTTASCSAPVSTAGNHLPIGFFDAINNGVALGWTADSDTPSTSNSVDVYVNGPYGGGGTMLARVTANTARPDVTFVYPNFTGNHGFSYTIPNQYRDNVEHKLYVYGIDSIGGPNVLLKGSPRTFTLAPVVASVDNSSQMASVIASMQVYINVLKSLVK